VDRTCFARALLLHQIRPKCYDDSMVTTREQALEIAAKVRAGLETIYGERLRGVYLYGSAARDEMREESDIDIAVVLDEVTDSFAEHMRISELRSGISLEHDTLVSLLLISEVDFETRRFAVCGAVRDEGIPA
jgi:predicted nucleotidyltransferase